MFRHGKRRDVGSAVAYRYDRRIAIVGQTPWQQAATTSDLLVVVDNDADDLALGTALVSVLDAYGRRPPSDQQDAVVEAFGLSPQSLDRLASAVSVEQRHEYDEVVLSPWRKDPPRGWVGNVFDPVFIVSAGNLVGVGTLLRKAFDVADELPTGP